MDEQRRFYVTMTSDAFPDPEDAFAIWDDQNNDYYIKGDGTVPTFPTEAQAEVFLSRLEDKIAGRSKPSIRTQLAEAQQNREKEQVQRLIDVLDKSMEAYKTEWSKASDDYLIADAHFICAVKDAYEYLTETHRFTPEEVECLLRSNNPLHAVASKWWEHQNDMSDFPLAIADAVKEQREAYGKETKRHAKEAR